MKAVVFVVLLALLVGSTPRARAHEVHHDIGVDEAVVVTLRYADGTPFAFEEAEIRDASGRELLFVTRSDAQGRVVFLPPGDGPWIVRVISADGHGAEVRVEASVLEGGATAPSAPVAASTGLLRIAAGVLLILGLFAILARIARSPRVSGGHDRA